MARSRISGCGCSPRASGPSSCRPAPVGGCARPPLASPRWVSRGPAGRPSRPRARPGHRWKPSSLKTFRYLPAQPPYAAFRASADRPGAANRAFEILRAMLTAARQWGELAEHVPNACANIVRNPRRPVGPLISLRRTICVNLSIVPISSVGRIRYTSSSAPMRDSRGHNMPVRYTFEGRGQDFVVRIRTDQVLFQPVEKNVRMSPPPLSARIREEGCAVTQHQRSRAGYRRAGGHPEARSACGGVAARRPRSGQGEKNKVLKPSGSSWARCSRLSPRGSGRAP